MPLLSRPALTIERYRDAQKHHRWRAVAANGKIVADSGQGYRRRADMEHALHLLAHNLTGAVYGSETESTAGHDPGDETDA